MALMALPVMDRGHDAELTRRFTALAAAPLRQVHLNLGLPSPAEPDYLHAGITRVPFITVSEVGSFKVRIQDHGPVRLLEQHPGVLVVHAPGTWVQHVHSAPGSYLRMTCDSDLLLVGCAIIRRGRDCDDPNDHPPLRARVLAPPPGEPIPGLIQALLASHPSEPARRKALARAFLVEIAHALQAAPAQTSPVHELRAWICEHGLRPGIGRRALARAFACSEGHVSRLLAPWGGVAAEIERVRLEHAIERMRQEPAVTILCIARDCGFVDASHFSRRFRARRGISPGAWRRHLLQKQGRLFR